MAALTTTAVGSYPKPDYLAQARNQFSQGKLDREDLERLERQGKNKRAALEAQIAALRAEIEATDIEMEQTHREAEQYEVNMAEMSLSKAEQPGRRRGRQKKKS